MSSRTQREGYLMLDHTASPGLPADVARRMGLDPKLTAEGKLLEAATIACGHCPGVFIRNPDRKRARGYCRQCDHYICDGCAAAAHEPDYVHRTRWDIMNLVMAGLNPFSVKAPASIIVP